MVVYSLKIANELLSKGFEIKNVGINVKDVSKKVFVFEDSDELFVELEKHGIKIKK